VKKPAKKIPQPNYVRKLHYLYAIDTIPREGVAKVDVLHDDYCALLTSGGRRN
jgi:hypothetical protein